MRRWRWALLLLTLALAGCEPGQVTVRVNSPQDVRLDAAAVVPAGSDEVATALLKALCGGPWQVFPRTRSDLVSIEAHRHFGTRDYPAVKVEQRVIGPLGLRRETRLTWPNPLAKLPKDDWRRAILASLKGELQLRLELPGRITKDSAAGATRDGRAAVWTLSLADLGAKGEPAEFTAVGRSVRWGLLAFYLALLAVIGWIVQPALQRSPEQRAAAAERRRQRAADRAARQAAAAARKAGAAERRAAADDLRQATDEVAALTAAPSAAPTSSRRTLFGRRPAAAPTPEPLPVAEPAAQREPEPFAALPSEPLPAAEPAAQPEPERFAALPSEPSAGTSAPVVAELPTPAAEAALGEALEPAVEPPVGDEVAVDTAPVVAPEKARRRGCLGFLRRRRPRPAAAPTTTAEPPMVEPPPAKPARQRRSLFGRRRPPADPAPGAPVDPQPAPAADPAPQPPVSVGLPSDPPPPPADSAGSPGGPSAVRRRRQGYGSMPRRR